MFAQKLVDPMPHPDRSARSPQPSARRWSVASAALAYNPSETHEEFRARQRRAYDAGRHAWQERRMPAYLIPFYESLVERVGANTYTWVSEETLAAAFQVDVSTIKRWIAKLVRSGLIRRQRQFGTSSRTYLTAYDPPTIPLAGEADTTTGTHASALPREAGHDTFQRMAHPDSQEDSVTRTDSSSFRRTDEPSFGADLPQDLKTDHLNHGGGEIPSDHVHRSAAPDSIHVLEQEGVHDFYVASWLRHSPASELAAISQYLDQQQNIRDRARLFAALACRGFGAQLLAGRRQPESRRGMKRGTSASTDDHLKYVSGALAPYLMTGRVPPTPAAPASSTISAACPAPYPDESCHDHAQIWQQVLARVRQTLPSSEFLTWFDDAVLLDLDVERAVIGTPNIFVREKVAGEYQDDLARAFHGLCGQDIAIQVVLGG